MCLINVKIKITRWCFLGELARLRVKTANIVLWSRLRQTIFQKGSASSVFKGRTLSYAPPFDFALGDGNRWLL